MVRKCLNGAPNVLCTSLRSKNEVKHWTVDPTFWPHTTHLVAKGDNDSLEEEVLKGTYGHVKVPPRVWECLKKEIDDAIALHDITPLSFQEAWDTLNKQASPGEPWADTFPTKQDFEDKGALPELLEFCEALEEEIISGQLPEDEWPIMAFKVHSKRDKYSTKKIKTKRFRSIQGLDVVLNLIMARWLAKFDETIYDRFPHIFVKNNPQTWCERITKGFAGLRTWGCDYTAFDKSIPENVVGDIVGFCMQRVGAPQNLCDFVARQVSQGPLVMPTGDIIHRTGSNPSGEYLTTIVNSFYNYMMIVDCFGEVLQVPPEEVKQHMSFVITGDDALLGSQELELEKVEEATQLISDKYCIATKLDLYHGELYPSDPGCHAPYLGQVSVGLDQETFVSVPFEPMRTLTRAVQAPMNDKPQDRALRMTGVRQAFAGYYVLRELSPSYPIPVPVNAFMDYFDDFYQANPQLDWQGALPIKQIVQQIVGVVEEGRVEQRKIQ
mgnify:CR=1 FL=1